MIFGDCPYEDCDDTHALPSAEHTPAFSKEACAKCGRTYWLYHSRFEPEAYTLDGFAAKFEVNEETKEIETDLPAPPHPEGEVNNK